MRLEDIGVMSMFTGLNTTSGFGTNASIEFFTTSVPSAMTSGIGILGGAGASTRLSLYTTALNTAFVTNTTYTQDTATFNTISSATVQYAVTTLNIIPVAFAILNTTSSVYSYPNNFVLTGTVGVTTGDIIFNTTSWNAGDNVSITSLNYIQPK